MISRLTGLIQLPCQRGYRYDIANTPAEGCHINGMSPKEYEGAKWQESESPAVQEGYEHTFVTTADIEQGCVSTTPQRCITPLVAILPPQRSDRRRSVSGRKGGCS